MAKKRLMVVVLVLGVVLLTMWTGRAEVRESGLDPRGYLPVALRAENTPTPMPTPTNTSVPPTPVNTPTATATSAPPANVLMTLIEYNPPGNDVDGEYVEIKNFGGTAANMTSWTLRDDDLHVFTFPSFSLGPNGVVKVWTKAGVNNGSNLYWGSGAAIWNNTGDTAILRNAGGVNVDVCSYVGGGQTAMC